MHVGETVFLRVQNWPDFKQNRAKALPPSGPPGFPNNLREFAFLAVPMLRGHENRAMDPSWSDFAELCFRRPDFRKRIQNA